MNLKNINIIPSNEFIKVQGNSDILKDKKYYNGKVLTIDRIEKNEDNIDIFVNNTDYESAILSNFSETKLNTLHYSMIIKSKDNKYLWGKRSNKILDNNLWSYPLSGHIVNRNFKELVEGQVLENFKQTILENSSLSVMTVQKTNNKTEFIILNEVNLTSWEITKIILKENIPSFSNFFWSNSFQEILNIDDKAKNFETMDNFAK